MNLEASQVAARHFELAMFRQHQGATAKITDRGGGTTLFKRTSERTRRRQQQYDSPRGACDRPASARDDVD